MTVDDLKSLSSRHKLGFIKIGEPFAGREGKNLGWCDPQNKLNNFKQITLNTIYHKRQFGMIGLGRSTMWGEVYYSRNESPGRLCPPGLSLKPAGVADRLGSGRLTPAGLF